MTNKTNTTSADLATFIDNLERMVQVEKLTVGPAMNPIDYISNLYPDGEIELCRYPIAVDDNDEPFDPFRASR